MYAIRLKNVSKKYRIYKKPLDRIIDSIFNTIRYEEFTALNNISLDIKQGDAVGVLGKNGAGKSTLLKIITGVVTPTEGTVSINGKISAILELNSGFDGELTGYQNIYLKGNIMGYSNEEIDEKINDIIEFADIGKYIYQPVKNYSSGMKSRLGFAIAVNVDPDILIVDEALSVGDDIFKTKCLNKMTEFMKNGKTIFFVSHSLFTVKSFCNKCIWIKDGKLMAYDELQKVMPLYENFLKEEKAKEKERQKKENKSLENNKNIMTKKDIIEVKKFEFKDKNNKFKLGDDISYKFEYEVKQELEGLKWSFTIRDIEKKEIYSTDKMNSNYKIEHTVGKHSISINIKNVNLLPGKYLLSGELREESGIMYVGYSNKKEFEITPNGDYKGTGIVYFDHQVLYNK